MLVFLLACAGPKGEPPPAWANEAGRDQVRVELAQTLIDTGQSDAALRLLAAMQTEGVENPELTFLHGRALLDKGLYSEAERSLISARDRMRRDPRPHRQLGILYADTGRTADAIASFKAALDLEDNDAETWNNLGYIQLAAGEAAAALSALERAIALDGSSSRYRNNLGFALAANGDSTAALQAFRSTGTEADAHANMGLAHELAGDLVHAVAAYSEALETNPTHVAAKDALTRLEHP